MGVEDELDARLHLARSPQRDAEASRLRSRVRGQLFGATQRARVGRYELGEVLGRGGHGVVYRAHDPQLDRDVALKVLRPHTFSDPEAALAFLVSEARAIAQLSHPNVIEVFDAGRVGDEVYIAMELVDGVTLADWLAPGRGWDASREVLEQAGHGLAHAHAAGIVHRDFKPGNVMVGRDGRVRVLDFGLAQALRTSTALAPAGGTPAYMAPEQLLGGTVDARADQFAFCVVAFEALHRARPFRGRHRGTIEPTPRSAPARIDAAVRRGLSHKPEDRFPDIDSLLRALRPKPRRRWPAWIAAAGIGLALGVATQSDEEATACTVDAPSIDEVWSPARAASVEAAFDRTGVSHAAETWSNVSNGIDAYRDAWSSAYVRVCDAPDDKVARLSQRLRCLDHRLGTLRVFLDLLEDADPRMVALAANGVANLPRIDACVQAEGFESEFPPANTAAQLLAFSRIEKRLAEVKSHQLAARYDAAADAAGDALDQARDVGSAKHAAQAMFHLARAARSKGDSETATEHMTAALWTAMGSHADTTAVDSAVDLVELLGHDLGRFDEAERMVRQARALVSRAANPQAREGWLSFALAKVHMARRRYADAREQLEHALAAAERFTPADRQFIGSIHTSLAGVAEAESRFDDALVHNREALGRLVAQLGPRHPEVGNAKVNMGVLLHRMGDSDAGIEELEAGLDILTASMPTHSMTGTAHNNLGLVLMHIERNEEAMEQFRIAFGILESTMPATHPYVGMLQGNLGLLAAKLGEPDAAREHLGRALVVLGEAMGPQDPVSAKMTLAWGELERREGNADLALELYERTLELLTNVPGHNPTRAKAELGIAEIRRAPG